MQLAQGQVIGERYRLERLLGEGGMGAVWSAVHLVTRKPVALKFIKETDDAKTPQFRRRFLREARAASAVRHPNVVQIHDILELEDGSPVMVMDLLEGESLAERLARDVRLSLGDTARILVPVISAVGTAHAAGVVHRDLKPDNIFLAHAPGETTSALDVKVLDFGIAKFTSAELESQTAGGLTQTGAMLGTPYYMSPEQAFGENDIDHRADVWAIGVMLYECLAGQRPIEGDNVGQIIKVIVTGGVVPLEKAMPSLPRDVTDLVGRMLGQKRDERLGDLREAAAILKKYTDVAYTSFEGPRAIIAPASSKKLIESGETLDADPFARTTDASGPQKAALVTANAHVVASAPPQKRAGRTWMIVAGAAVAAGLVYWRIGLAPSQTETQTQQPSLAHTQTHAPALTAAPSMTAAAATESVTAHASVTAPASVSAIATHKPVPALGASASAKAQASATVAPAASASVLPGGVYGKSPF